MGSARVGLAPAALALALAVGLGPAPSLAQTEDGEDGARCEVAAPMSPTRLLRRLSLDLRGRAPSYAELEATRDAGAVPPDLVDAWLEGEELLSVMRAHHEALLWPNLDQVELVGQLHTLYPFPIGQSGEPIYVSPLRSVFFRTAGPGNLFEPCANRPAEYDADGRLVLWPRLVGTTTVAWVEGYVEVRPYWAPDTTIRVCALEALEAERAPACPDDPGRYPFLEPTCASIEGTAQAFGLAFRGEAVDCDGPLATFAPGCGCGSDLRRCHVPETLARLRADLNEQALRLVERVIAEGRPYHEILTDRTVEVSGPIAHFMRHQARLTLDLFADPDPELLEVDLGFTSGRWVPVTRGPRHAGVLTTPAYLMRHAAWRQRAHRFYDAFECASFEPRGPLPSPFAPCSQNQDLTERCGCADCHRTLEPMAAHWGRFAEHGFMSLDEPRFPTVGLERCQAPFASLEALFNCFRLYELDPVGEEARYVGYLNAYVFRSAAEAERIERGPSALVDDALASGRLAACVVERMWTRFMHREPTPDEAAEVLPALTETFETANHDLRALIGAIVRQPAYGRAP